LLCFFFTLKVFRIITSTHTRAEIYINVILICCCYIYSVSPWGSFMLQIPSEMKLIYWANTDQTFKTQLQLAGQIQIYKVQNTTTRHHQEGGTKSLLECKLNARENSTHTNNYRMSISTCMRKLLFAQATVETWRRPLVNFRRHTARSQAAATTIQLIVPDFPLMRLTRPLTSGLPPRHMLLRLKHRDSDPVS
jgi:hypothetical protein